MRPFRLRSSTTKELERKLFAEFCRLNPWLKLRLVDQPEPPAPDVLAEFGDDMIGIEIMRYFSSEHRKQCESEDNYTLDLAKRHYESNVHRNVNVRVSWAPYRSRRVADRSAVALAVSKFVSTSVPPVGSSLTIDTDALPAPLDQAVNYISLERFAACSDNCWRSNLAGWFAPLQVEDVQELINRKEQNIGDYKKSCEAVWLIISTENSPSAWCQLAPAAESATYKTMFDRVFIVADVPKKSFALETSSSEATR